MPVTSKKKSCCLGINAVCILLAGIRDYIINKSVCVCGATSILADDLLPNKTLRETISRILEAPPTSSTENVGSMVQVQGMLICFVCHADNLF